MNAKTRKRIMAISEQIVNLRYELEELTEREQSAYDNLPESLQENDKAKNMLDCVDNLTEATQSLSDVQDYLEEIINS